MSRFYRLMKISALGTDVRVGGVIEGLCGDLRYSRIGSIFIIRKYENELNIFFPIHPQTRSQSLPTLIMYKGIEIALRN